jgi:threonyl-tRNA synthetase
MAIKEVPQLEKMRHTASHILAQAVLKYYPDTKLGIGPAIENGFYYDFEFVEPIEEEDLEKLEKEMKKIIKKNLPLEQSSMKKAEAKKYLKKIDQPYKVELLDGIEDKEVSFYTTGAEEFVDLCRGPHVENTGQIGAIKLERIAGAYWKGDEKNKMLTRIYGLAFETQEELKEYAEQQEQAKKRDHKVLGTQLGLFMFHETAPGMPYWLPKGLILYNELVNFWRNEHKRLGYKEIASPLINKAELWKTSGHWDHYHEHMFVADMSEEGDDSENEIYGVKAMNCPNAMIVFQNMQVSYRDLPLRLSDIDRLHRYEKSGTLNGLLRVRSFQQDDSHNFITEDMIGDEYQHIFEICERFYSIFNMEYTFRLGTRPEKFMGDRESWDKAEEQLKEVLENSGKEYFTEEGDGAFYGPKVDILMKDIFGREWQMGTIQLDYQLPKNFELEYTDKDGDKKQPVVVHRVIYGSLERFIGILIEHYGGDFPLWLAPEQIHILPIGKDHREYAEEVNKELIEKGFRSIVNHKDQTLPARIRDAETMKIPYILVIGDKEIENKGVAVRSRHNKDAGLMKLKEFTKKLNEEIKLTKGEK